MLEIRTAIITVADSREDYFVQRAHFANEFLDALQWVKEIGACYVSPVVRRSDQIETEIRNLKKFGAQSVVIHIPIWADPAFASGIAMQTDLPPVLLGNTDSATSSVVGLLGAGGALDQLNRRHERIVGLENGGRERLIAFIKAAAAVVHLRGKSMVRFGDSSLGIMTASPDTMLWMKDFGVSVRHVDQSEIAKAAGEIGDGQVRECRKWLSSVLGGITFREDFTPDILCRQIRSYLATRRLAEQYRASFIGVKCQPELSNHYTVQCLAHMILNGTQDETGEKMPLVHACESDANGAITMYLLGLLSGGPASLMDVRKVDVKSGRWILANCGAVPSDHYATSGNCPLKGVRMCRHAFGEAGGGACSGTVKSGEVTMARLCLKENRHWMAIVRGVVQEMDEQARSQAPAQFPAALVQTAPVEEFLQVYDSNHIHITFGDVSQALVEFCKLKGISYQVW